MYVRSLILLTSLLLSAVFPTQLGVAQSNSSMPALPPDPGLQAYFETARLTPQDILTYEAFGLSAALDCTSSAPDCTAVIGAPYAGPDGERSGAAYIFERQGAGPWLQTARLVASDPSPEARFGFDVAIDGDTVAVSAPGADSASLDSGAVYIFERDYGGPDAWGQVALRVPSDSANYDAFGRAVALDGDTLVASTYIKIPGGAAYVFERDQGGPDAWGEVQRLAGHNTDWGDGFGIAVDIDVDLIIVGAYAGGDYVGQAYIFQRDTQNPKLWNEIAWLTASDAYPYDYFGYAVAIHGDMAVAGAPGDEGLTGAAYIYLRDQGGPDAWGQAAKLTASDAAQLTYFGIDLEAESGLVLVGAPDANQFTGAAYLFRCLDNLCLEEARLLPSDPTIDAGFGYGPAISNANLLTGAPGADVAGAAYFYEFTNMPPISLELDLSVPAILEGATITTTASFASLEPTDAHTLTLRWGDGLSETVALPSGIYTATLSHLVSDDPPSGTPVDLLPLTLTVSDAGGLSTWLTASLTVSNVAPLVQAGAALTLTAGESFTRTGSFFDPGADTWTATVDYGDGTGPQPLTLTGSTYQFDYIFVQPGIYQVTVTITDDDGGTGTAQFAVTVLQPDYFTVYLPITLRR